MTSYSGERFHDKVIYCLVTKEVDLQSLTKKQKIKLRYPDYIAWYLISLKADEKKKKNEIP